MNVKIMLNKDEEIKELAKDPEVQVKIKAAIIDGIGTRAIKAVQNVLARDIETAVEREVYKGHTFNLKNSVSEEIEKRVKQAVDYTIVSKISNIMEKEFYSIVRKRADECVETINQMNLTFIVEKKVKEILERKLRQ